jgi:hypothetical protein
MGRVQIAPAPLRENSLLFAVVYDVHEHEALDPPANTPVIR